MESQEQPQEQVLPEETILPPAEAVETAQPAEPDAAAEERAPTKTVKTFWERLDEVFRLNVESAKMNEKIEELLEQFPDEERISTQRFNSYLFQPSRIGISSNEDITLNTNTILSGTVGQYNHQLVESFNSFRVRLAKSLVNVKSIQLLSAVIPNAIQNIPDNSVIFFYYKLRTVDNANLGAYDNGTTYYPGDIVTFLTQTYVCAQITTGAQPVGTFLGSRWYPIALPLDGTRPNYCDLNPYRIQVVFLNPTNGLPVESVGTNANPNLMNRTFTDYTDLVAGLNACAASATNASVPGELIFSYSPILNRIGVEFTNNTFYYLPCGWDDPNIKDAINYYNQGVNNWPVNLYVYNDWSPGYTLNLRLGYTWTGVFANPFTSNYWALTGIILSREARSLVLYMRENDPAFPAPLYNPANLLTFNSYPDLVNTSCVRIYTDVTFASTDEGSGWQNQPQGGLLSIVPVNASNLGVSFYQNNFNNPLTKIPKIISEIGIRLVNDQGDPFNLPNSATVLLELAVEYY